MEERLLLKAELALFLILLLMMFLLFVVVQSILLFQRSALNTHEDAPASSWLQDAGASS